MVILIYALRKLLNRKGDNPVRRPMDPMADRAFRREIEELRERGYRVVSTSGKPGYWIAKNDKEYREFRENYSSKAFTILRHRSAMDAYTEGQVEL